MKYDARFRRLLKPLASSYVRHWESVARVQPTDQRDRARRWSVLVMIVPDFYTRRRSIPPRTVIRKSDVMEISVIDAHDLALGHISEKH